MSAIKVEKVTAWEQEWNNDVRLRAKRLMELHHLIFNDLLRMSNEFYMIRDALGNPILFLAVVPLQLIGGQAYLWMVPFKALQASHMRYARKAFNQWAKTYHTLSVQIFHNDPVGQRFAEFFGFKEFLSNKDCKFYARKS